MREGIANYSSFNEDMRLFLNKAMDVYSAIKDKKIVKKVKERSSEKEYEFSSKDKKALSLLIASFLYGGSLSKILYEQSEIKLNDLFNFVDIKEEDIIKLDDLRYEEFYNDNFKLDIFSFLKQISEKNLF